MSGWIKMGTGLGSHPKVKTLRRALSLDASEMLATLYAAACWVAEHGEYGRVQASTEDLDLAVEVDGFAQALIAVGWLRKVGPYLEPREFCAPFQTRKSLGSKLRARILGVGKCAFCGSTENLEIDHRKPIARGGNSDEANLQPLCRPCNRRKGTSDV